MDAFGYENPTEALNILIKYLGDDKISDGHHTFKELYQFRMVYNAALFNEWHKLGKFEVHKSRRHHDGELCFGSEGWFIVVAQLPTGQISNHYKTEEAWDLFKIPERDVAAVWDGHTPQDVMTRMITELVLADDKQSFHPTKNL